MSIKRGRYTRASLRSCRRNASLLDNRLAVLLFHSCQRANPGIHISDGSVESSSPADRLISLPHTRRHRETLFPTAKGKRSEGRYEARLEEVYVLPTRMLSQFIQSCDHRVDLSIASRGVLYISRHLYFRAILLWKIGTP